MSQGMFILDKFEFKDANGLEIQMPGLPTEEQLGGKCLSIRVIFDLTIE
jgi:hypothetical protein